ncbi:hypothetical protein RhiirA4_505528 [Rhizophagus irregularis]|uniref:Uncharacterized protein n=1 Tax=Rhizophagus irregularis TaxID=588596 RepID=A0A2I1HAH0_9GLOM|nr:hypothetical protein RhiirA4_505528 [Rhizophagus irregularis]
MQNNRQFVYHRYQHLYNNSTEREEWEREEWEREKWEREKREREEWERKEEEREYNRMVVIKENFSEFLGDMRNIIKELVDVLDMIIDFFKNTVIKFGNNNNNFNGVDNDFCRTLKDIRNDLVLMIDHLEKNPSDFSKFRRIAYDLELHTKTLRAYIEDMQKQLEEILREEQKHNSTFSLGSLLKLAKDVYTSIAKTLLSSKAAKYAAEIFSKFSSVPAHHIHGIIFIGLAFIGFGKGDTQKNVNNSRELSQQLRKLEIKISTMNDYIPKNKDDEEKYKIMAPKVKTLREKSEEEYGLIKQLREYEKSIKKFKDLLCPNC